MEPGANEPVSRDVDLLAARCWGGSDSLPVLWSDWKWTEPNAEAQDDDFISDLLWMA